MSIVLHNDLNSHNFSSPFTSLIPHLGIKRALQRAHFIKVKGESAFDMFTAQLNSCLMGDNLWRAFNSTAKAFFPASRAAMYRFMANDKYNWSMLCMYIASNASQKIMKLNPDDTFCFVVDDSLEERSDSAKYVEKCTMTFDHNSHTYVKGFTALQLGWTDGHSFLTMGSKLLASNESNRKRKACSPRPKRKKAIVTDKRTYQGSIRAQADSSKPDLVVDWVKQALNHGIKAEYILMDSWFNYEPLLKKLKELKVDTIGMLKLDNRKYSVLNNRGKAKEYLSLEDICPLAKKKHRKSDPEEIIGSIKVMAHTNNEPVTKGIPLKLVFIRNRHNKEDFLVLASTDTSLDSKRIVQLYARRWKIETNFHNQKAFFGMNSECQSTDFTTISAYANLACIRANLMEYKRRIENDVRAAGELFYSACQALKEIPFADALNRLLQAYNSIVDDLEKAGCIAKGKLKKAKKILKQKLSVWYDESSAYIQKILELYSTEITSPILKRIK